MKKQWQSWIRLKKSNQPSENSDESIGTKYTFALRNKEEEYNDKRTDYK